ncbi:MAG: helix-turn-helix transcriptional regulator [Sedimentisphaerales bacterium]
MTISVGKAIKIIRNAKGISLGDLAIQSRISVPYLSLLESEKRKPSLTVIGQVADALDIPVDVFILLYSGHESTLTTKCNVANRLLTVLTQMENFEKRINDAISNQNH